MSRIVKHIGKHNNRKVVIVYKKVPGEDHMCLVVYPDSLPMMYHDELMKVLESPVGQNAKELADALFRHLMPDGNNTLVSLHKGGALKKVPTNQVIVTPNASSNCRLDELNNILEQMDQGNAAVKKLAELDANAGMTGTKRQVAEGRELGQPTNPMDTFTSIAGPSDILTDEAIAQQRAQQAARFRAEAQSLLAEAQRLEEEAKALVPSAVITEKAAKSTNVRKPRTKKVPA